MKAIHSTDNRFNNQNIATYYGPVDSENEDSPFLKPARFTFKLLLTKITVSLSS